MSTTQEPLASPMREEHVKPTDSPMIACSTTKRCRKYGEAIDRSKTRSPRYCSSQCKKRAASSRHTKRKQSNCLTATTVHASANIRSLPDASLLRAQPPAHPYGSRRTAGDPSRTSQPQPRARTELDDEFDDESQYGRDLFNIVLNTNLSYKSGEGILPDGGGYEYKCMRCALGCIEI